MIFTDYWKALFLQLFGDGKYGHFLSPEVDGKIIFTGYWEVLFLIFLVIGNTVFFSAKMKMERRYLLGLFALCMIFQDLRNMVFRAVFESSYFIRSSNQNSKTELYGLLVLTMYYVLDMTLIFFFGTLKHFFYKVWPWPVCIFSEKIKNPE